MRAHHLLHRAGLQRVGRAAEDDALAGLRRRALLDATTVVFDVGASGGQYGSLLRAVGYRRRIVSYEPQPEAHEVLASRARRDPAWEAHRCALGASGGRATLHVAANSQSSSLHEMLPAHEAAEPRSATTGSMEVEVRSVDAELAGRSTADDVLYVKLDVQGAELELLRALGPATVSRAGAFEVELSLVPLYRDAPLAEEVITQLRSMGFAPVAVAPNFVDAATGRLLQVDALFLR